MNNKIVILDDSVILYQHYISDEAWESVMAFPRGGLTYLIKNNNIKFYAYVDYFYRNCLMTMDLPIYIVDEELGIDGEYDDIQEITEILDRIFPSANGDIDLTPYLKKREAEELYQPIGDYLSREDADTLYQPIGDYLSANSLVGYATEQWVENKGYIDKIKTINNQSLLGEGNIEISGGTVDAYTKAEADERFQPIGDYVSRTTFITYISNLTQQIESLQETIEECCSGSGETLYRWITLTGPNDYICSGTTKYAKEQKQQSTDNGATWQNVSPAEYRAGILIETDSPDCGYEPVIEYRWVTVSGEYVCSGTTKYNKEKKQYRVDGGAWTDTSPLQTRRGSTVIETQSPDCGYVPPQYRWWQAPASDYICSGTTKYYKEYYQVSYDGGSTWQNVSPEQTRRGAVIESQSTDCGYVEPQYRWHQAPASDYICSGTTKYYKEYYQVSYDGGSTWQNVSPEQTRRGSVIETQSADCGYEPTSDNQYLTFIPSENGTFKFNKIGSGNDIQYSLDSGSTWVTLASNTNTPTINSGKKIMWKGNITSGPTVGTRKSGIFSSSGRFVAEGNPMSLTFGDNFVGRRDLGGNTHIYESLFANCTKLTSAENLSLPATTLERECYEGMFAGCTSLTTAPALPATKMALGCYMAMFEGCTKLTTAPALPATTLASGCYNHMFGDCTSLTTAPVLPATVMQNQCYYQMFANCTSLTTAPALNSTTLETSCYESMFANCTKLTTAPALPATTLVSGCYQSMFAGCTSLTTAPVLPAMAIPTQAYRSMFASCTSLTTAPALPATTLRSDCYGFMFVDCTSLTTAPVLPATTLDSYCYEYMFNGCSHLNYIKCLATNIRAMGCTSNWVDGVSSSGTFVKASSMSNWTSGINGIPNNWAIQNA